MDARIIFTEKFRQSYKQLSPDTRKTIQSKLRLLMENPAHPSLQSHRLRRAKAKDVWVCYISMNKRLLYQYKGGTLYLLDVGIHAVVDRVHQRKFAL